MNLAHRLTGLFVSIGLACAITSAASAPAHADTPAPSDQLVLSAIYAGQNPNANIVTGTIFSLRQHGGTPAAGTTIHVAVFSCGQFIQQNTKVTDGNPAYSDAIVPVEFSPSGGLDSSPNTVNAKVGPSVEYYIDIVQPGFDAYHLSGSYSGYNVKRPSCAQILGGGGGGGGGTGAGCTVRKWSTVKGAPLVGHTVRATKPKTSAACGKVSYVWKAGGRTVGKGKSLRITQGIKGAKLKLSVKVKHGGSKTIGAGRVH